MFSTQKLGSCSFFAGKKESSASNVMKTQTLKLGTVSVQVPYCKMPGHDRYFLYFKLNDHPLLVDEAARLIAERIKGLNLKNPFFVTPEASTLALAHMLRSQYDIPGLTIYKNPQINDVDPVCIEYDTVTATNKKTLYLGQDKVQNLQGRDILIIDSVCTTGGTIRATYELLVKAGVSPENIVEASMLFNEGKDLTQIAISSGVNLKIHRFGMLPVITNENQPLRIYP